MGRYVKLVLLVCFLTLNIGAIGHAQASEVDLLLQKLVEKGILTPGEAQQVAVETKEQVKKEIAQAKYDILPQWLQTTKLKGDFRVRYQYDHAKQLVSNPGATDEHRARIRVRLGVESKVNDKLKVGIGLATGTTDVTSKDAARSTNQTLGGSFAKKPIALDYAYAEYTPKPWATFIGGKFKNPIWEPGDLMWDTDINPEGAATKLSYKVNPKLNLFLNTGVLIVDENLGGSNDDDDPMLYVAQPGLEYAFSDTIGLKTALSYYSASNVKGRKLAGTVGTNSNVGGNLLYDYINVMPEVELTIKEPLKALGVDLPYLALFGEYVKNTNSAVKDRNTGFMVGAKFGVEKVAKWADWQVRYNYAMLGKDAVIDILPDSDRYGGKTGMRSHEVMFDWGLGTNTWLGLDYYYGWQLPGNFGATQTKPASVVQVDWNMKF